MTRKEALKQIAQRCMDGDLKKYMNFRLQFADCVPAKYYGLFANACSSLDAVADLEAELLPDGWMIDVAVNEKMSVARTFKLAECTSEATASTEALARLAALCLALAEIDE